MRKSPQRKVTLSRNFLYALWLIDTTSTPSMLSAWSFSRGYCEGQDRQACKARCLSERRHWSLWFYELGGGNHPRYWRRRWSNGWIWFVEKNSSANPQITFGVAYASTIRRLPLTGLVMTRWLSISHPLAALGKSANTWWKATALPNNGLPDSKRSSAAANIFVYSLVSLYKLYRAVQN